MHKQELNKVEDSEKSKLVFNMFENLIELFICKITHYFITEKKNNDETLTKATSTLIN